MASVQSFTATYPQSYVPVKPSRFKNFLPEVFRRVSDYIHRHGSLMVHPAPMHKFRTTEKHILDQCRTDLKGEEVAMVTPDGVTLNGMYFQSIPPNASKAIVYFGGNCEHYEFSAENFLKFLQDEKIGSVDVLYINPRETGKSGGTTSPDLLPWDAYTAMEYLIQKKRFRPSSIIPIGRSLGGAYGTIGASYIQEKYPKEKIHAFNLFSFVDLPTIVEHIVNGIPAVIDSYNQEKYPQKKISFFTASRIARVAGFIFGMITAALFRRTLVSLLIGGILATALFSAGIVGKVAAIFTRHFVGVMDVKSAWRKLKGDRFCMACEQDGIIDYKASLLANLPKGAGTKITFSIAGESLRKAKYHNLPFETYPKAFVETLKKTLQS